MGLLDFKYAPKALLSLTEDAIQYAVGVTRNLLYETDLNSPMRLLVEAQAYVYNQFLLILSQAEDALTFKLLSIFSFTPSVANNSKALLRFEIITTSPTTENVYIPKSFPTRSTNGIIFLTDTVLMIPLNTNIGYVWATAIRAGQYGNVAANTITQPLQTINYSLKVTNPDKAQNGKDGETIVDAQFRLAAFIRKNGLISANNYIDFVREIIPNAIVSVASLEPNTVSVWVANPNGANLNQNQFNRVYNALNQNRMIGLRAIVLADIEIVKVYIEVVASITFPSRAEATSDEVRNAIFSYVSPENLRQTQNNTAGILERNDLIKILGTATIDVVQGIRLGLIPDAAYERNLEFNPNNQRLYCDRLRVVLIKGTFQNIRDYTR